MRSFPETAFTSSFFEQALEWQQGLGSVEGQEELKRALRTKSMFGLPTAYLSEGIQFLNLNKDPASYNQEFPNPHRPF